MALLNHAFLLTSFFNSMRYDLMNLMVIKGSTVMAMGYTMTMILLYWMGMKLVSNGLATVIVASTGMLNNSGKITTHLVIDIMFLVSWYRLALALDTERTSCANMLIHYSYLTCCQLDSLHNSRFCPLIEQQNQYVVGYADCHNVHVVIDGPEQSRIWYDAAEAHHIQPVLIIYRNWCIDGCHEQHMHKQQKCDSFGCK